MAEGERIHFAHDANTLAPITITRTHTRTPTPAPTGPRRIIDDDRDNDNDNDNDEKRNLDSVIASADAGVEIEAVPVEERDFRRRQVFTGWTLAWLAYQSTGVIYGDIGTSPLYVYSSTFTSPPTRDDLLGALSLIIWSLTLIVTLKYVLIVLCADDEGEGGTFAIYSLLSRYSNIMKRDPKTQATVKLERYLTADLRPAHRSFRSFLEHSKASHAILKVLAVAGVSLIMSDGVLTPAQSVLGAIQGLEVVVSDISSDTIVGVTCGILVALFLVQPLGIAKLGSIFAPIVIIWLLFNFSFGIYNLVHHDSSVLKAFSPYFAGLYFVRNGTHGWKSLGGILLCFTGVEALFADLGAFSKRAIQLSWLCFIYPCLLLAYIGQAAFIMDHPEAYSNPFFKTVPPGTIYPSLVIAVLAAIVASQAMITSTFQLLAQIMNLSYFPRIKMVYTSTHFYGQVFIPWANWLLMAGTIIVTVAYSNTTRLGNAYGVCVIMVTFITTLLVSIVALIVWRIHPLIVLIVLLPLITLDGLYLSAALVKVPDGAWFTLMLAGILATVFILWRFGKEQQWASESLDSLLPSKIISVDKATGREHLRDSTTSLTAHNADGGKSQNRLEKGVEWELSHTPGLGIFFDKAGTAAVPHVYAHFLRKFHARPKVHVFLHTRALHVPTVASTDRLSVTHVRGIKNCYRVVLRHGYNDEPVSEDLGSLVYTSLRSYIIRQKPSVQARRPSSDSFSTPPSASHSGAPSVSHVDSHANSINLEANTIEDRDAETAAALQALDDAYAAQAVYIVGKEQLRIISPSAGRAVFGKIKFNMLHPAQAMRRLALRGFIWIRENTRAKVAEMKIPVDRLVEVGFVKEI